MVEHFGNFQIRDRRELRRLQYQAVTRSERKDDLPHREEERRIERRNTGEYARRLADREAELPRHGGRHGLAPRSLQFRGSCPQQIKAIADFETRLSSDRTGFFDENVDGRL